MAASEHKVTDKAAVWNIRTKDEPQIIWVSVKTEQTNFQTLFNMAAGLISPCQTPALKSPARDDALVIKEKDFKKEIQP